MNKNKLVGLLAIVLSLAFTVPAFADGDKKDEGKDKGKGGNVVIYDKDDDEKKDDKGGK